jgi:hypothetical protein
MLKPQKFVFLVVSIFENLSSAVFQINLQFIFPVLKFLMEKIDLIHLLVLRFDPAADKFKA